MPMMPIPGSQMAMPTAMPVPQGLTMAQLQAQGDQNAQKQFLGEQLYPRVFTLDEARAGRIVGMILDALSFEQILDTINTQAAFKTNTDRVITAIMEFEANQEKETPKPDGK